ncbi:beta-glucosidase [Actinomycetota bacterium]|nr:beta-glucosidase [Actinomycetota bacterium]
MADGPTAASTTPFLWGAATAAHQIEGSNLASDYWHSEHAPSSPQREPSGDACDSYHRYPQDMALLAEAGLNSYRFSVEWARIEPERGEISRAQLDHYRRMIDTCRGTGLIPMVTLYHFSAPAWFTAEGGWAGPRALDHFSRYLEAVTPLVADLDWVCTINEPNMVAVTGWSTTDGVLRSRPLPVPDLRLTDGLVAGHRRAVEMVRALGRPLAGWSVAAQVVQAVDGADEVAAAHARPRETVFYEAARDDDFVGVQAYTRSRVGLTGPIGPPADAELTSIGWEYYPAAIGEALRTAWAVTGGVPLVVTENGISTADDARRIDYLSGALDSVADAMADGVDVRGYLAWSALDNYEWGSFDPTFGLIAVDRQTFERRPKPSLAWLGAVARGGVVRTPSR